MIEMYRLEMSREFNVPLGTLFAAWSRPDVMQRWFAPGEMTVPECDAEVVVGGEYRIVMKNAEDELFIVGGKYREVELNKKLVFTWQWEDSPHCTLVEIDFESVSDVSSRVLLKHSEFVDQETCDKHEQGWNACLVNLEKSVA